MRPKAKTQFPGFISISTGNPKRDTKTTILIFLVSLIFILLNETCYSVSFEIIQKKIRKNNICGIDYNPSKTAAIVNVDCGSAIYTNFNTKQSYTVVKHWPNVGSIWLTDNLAKITGPCGTGCSQSIIFVAPITSISCPVHEYRISSLSSEDPPDFYNNNPLLIEPHKKIYACYDGKNNIQVFKLPKKSQITIHPPKGYFSEKATIHNHHLVIYYENAKGEKKQIVYGKI